ncbi:M20/M25/M40 family metallo-hydrolase [Bacteroidota bacterium]
MRTIVLCSIIAMLFLSQNLKAQKSNPEISVDEIRKHIEFLASDEMKGRKPGSSEDPIIAAYIRDQFKGYGLTLLADDGYEKVRLVAGIKAGPNNSFSFAEHKGNLFEDFSPISFTQNASVEGEVVFVGFGYDIKNDKMTWNDYQGVDVTGKWALILLGEPKSSERTNPFEEYSALRTKVLTAKDHGAVGVIFVYGPQQNKSDDLIDLQYDKVESTAGIPVIQVKRSLADPLLAKSSTTIEELENKINTDLKPNSFKLNLTASAQTDVSLVWVNSQNIIAVVKSKNKKYRDEYIVVGAHYDHLGMGGYGSGSRFPDTVAVHNGADDNASGVAGVIELAGKINGMKKNLKRSIIFVAFTGEELGILGSKKFVEDQLVKNSQIKAMINFDMIGRFNEEEKSLLIGGSGTAEESDSLLNVYSKKHKLILKLSPEGYGPSDHASFYGNNIPVFFITTGAHIDYHSWSDDADKINYPGEQKVLNFALDLLENLATSEKSLTFKEAGPKSRTGGSSYKVTLGIMPDFAAGDVVGLRVEVVREGGPAFLGGMQNGDIIRAINGLSISNIYDYMNRLKKLEKGELVSVDVIRNGMPVVLIIQL